MRKTALVLIILCSLMFPRSLVAQVSEKIVTKSDTLNVSRDSIVQLIRVKDSLLYKIRHDSINMSHLILRLEYHRDSLNAALNQSIHRQKLDSAERMRRYYSFREYNRRTRKELYSPIGIIDKDSIRSSMKEIVDIVFEDTAFIPKPQILRSSMDRLLHHLANDSVFFRIVNTNHDTIPFVLKKNRIDSAAFFVMNSKNDSAKLFIRGLDKNSFYMWVGDDLMLKHLLKKKGAIDSIGITWKDPNALRIARRALPVPAAKLWYLKSELNFTVNQNTYVNWIRGGNNHIAMTTDVKAWANYAKGNISWNNSFWFVFGLQKTELLSLRKSADRTYIVSNLSHKAFKNFDYTLGTTFETQGFKGYADPKIAIIVTNPATESTAIPESAAPLVHPRASCAPYTKKSPPRKANINLRAFEIFGDFSILNLSLPEKAPEINPPATTPRISNVSQFFKGFLPASKYLL